MSIRLVLFLFYGAILASAVAQPTSGPGASSVATSREIRRTAPASTQPGKGADRPLAAADEIRRLIRQLGAPKYSVREAAQKKLAEFGEASMAYLVEFIGTSDPEISNRIAALITRPRDPKLRVEVAVRMLSTADPDWMEPAVYMLFQSPIEDYDLFIERTRAAVGIRREVFMPIAEQMENWKRMTEIFNRRYARLRFEKPAAAEKERELHLGSMYYQAEAAYWSAVEAAEEFAAPIAAPQSAASRPARR